MLYSTIDERYIGKIQLNNSNAEPDNGIIKHDNSKVEPNNGIVGLDFDTVRLNNTYVGLYPVDVRLDFGNAGHKIPTMALPMR